MYIVRRSTHNPLIAPNPANPWEARATFNPSPIKVGKMTHVLYRAMGSPDPLQNSVSVSVIGKGVMLDGTHVQNRKPFIVPEEPWERFGCEDPRVTHFEGTYYTFYTALSEYPFRASGIKVAVALSKDLETITERHLVTPFNAKAFTLFPERVNGKIMGILTVHTDEPPASMALVECEEIEDLWNPGFWEAWHSRLDEHRINPLRNAEDFAESGAVPIKTKNGWLFLYSYIQNYFSGNRVFGIEALLLDSKNPRIIVGRTGGPILVPEEIYERYGTVTDVVFPSGALEQKNGRIDLFYGASDTVCARASLNRDDVVATLVPTKRLTLVKRHAKNPILTPDPTHPWESRAIFNAAAIDIDGVVRILYRAMSEDNTSVFGYAESKNGLTISKRLPTPAYIPRAEFEMKKGSPTGNSGCEDPRLSRVGGTIYMTYTAYDGVNSTRVALSTIAVKDFSAERFDRFSMPILITPPGVDDKNTCILPKKIDGEYLVFHRINNQICADYVPDLDFSIERINRCIEIIGPRRGMWDSVKVGITGPPIETDAGWLLIYHGVSSSSTYRFGAVLLDKKNATTVLARTVDPIFEPTEQYEKVGQIPNVVFSCGVVRRDDTLFIYYGGADSVLGVATASVTEILRILQPKNIV